MRSKSWYAHLPLIDNVILGDILEKREGMYSLEIGEFTWILQ